MSDTFWPQSDRGNVFTSQVFDLDHAVRILAFDQPRGLRVCVCISTLPAPSGTEDSPWDGRGRADQQDAIEAVFNRPSFPPPLRA
jgi:hypothetical protein